MTGELPVRVAVLLGPALGVAATGAVGGGGACGVKGATGIK